MSINVSPLTNQYKIDNSFLKSSIHKNLLMRFLISACLVSVVLGAVAFTLEFQRLGQLVNKRASEVSIHFNHEITDILDSYLPTKKDLLHSKLKVLSSVGKLSLGVGNVIYAGIYTLDGEPMALEKDRNIAYMPDIDRLMVTRRTHLAKFVEKVYEFTIIHESLHILLTFPLVNSRNESVAVLSGVFAVSPSARNLVLWRLAKTILQTLGVALFTTLILYPLILALMNQLSKTAVNLLDSNIEILRVLGSAVAKRDCDTDIHNYRVTIYSVSIAEEMGLEHDMIRSLIKGAFLHDVGKIGITDNILLKPGKLTEEEFEIMKKHVNVGIDIVAKSDWLRDAVPVVGCHHEKYAGGGYPDGLTDDDIPLNARIFAIADVFDALTSERPYKKPFPFEKAMSILEEGRSSHFDPVLLNAFQKLAGSLHGEYAACSDDLLKEKLESITRTYFSEELYDRW